ncbi:hypothetical protein PRABACTJOHN_04388 [Parabacteroides johnsonii DSM 18315]|uniref:Uncharacterized protein n=1 Tax=Parabacteroides johnsonii DSM 18315 TaxID=537006 RepID=B7BH40_9BACT|nr:hypothetical protein PRABACTJOHN_04388 [Parabacteroides johnsonii DSM 18315]
MHQAAYIKIGYKIVVAYWNVGYDIVIMRVCQIDITGRRWRRIRRQTQTDADLFCR